MIAVKTYIEDSPIITTSVVAFSPQNKEEYVRLFNKFKHIGVIDKCSEFDEDKWLIKYGGVDKKVVSFIFSETIFKKICRLHNVHVTYNDFIMAVKSFFVYNLNVLMPNTLYVFICIFKIFIHKTEFTSKELNDELLVDYSILSYTPLILNFFMYFELFDFNDEFLENVRSNYSINRKILYKKKRRALPMFISMFRFNDIINDFIKEASGDERERFFPIILWWKITTILPQRTREFTLNPRECVDKGGSKPLIKINRSVIKGSVKSVYDHTFESQYELSTHGISNEVRELIEEYNSIISKYDEIDEYYETGIGETTDRKFLLSERSYCKFLKNKTTHDRLKYTLDYLNPTQLNNLLTMFLVEIVNGRYNIDIMPKQKLYSDPTEALFENGINNINLMDTRHFAIMNMVYQGYEPSTIQRIVGHKNINTSYEYFDHAEIFTNCFIISVAKEMAFEKNSQYKARIIDLSYEELLGVDGETNKRYRMAKVKVSEKIDHLKKLDEGYCIYEKNDFMPCKILKGNHRRCKYYIPYEKSVKHIDSELNRLTDEISAEIRTLRYIAENHKRIKNHRDLYEASMNKLHAKALIKSRMLCDYIMTGKIEE